MSRRRRGVGELRDQLGELADIDWRHPAWWLALAGTAALERLPAGDDADAAIVTSNGGPRADTFMARTRPTRTGPAERVVRAVARARAAVQVIDRLADAFPDQPLRCQLDARGSIVRRRPLPARPWVVFATPTGAYAALLDADPATDRLLAAELARACAEAPSIGHRLTRVDGEGAEPADAAVTVSLLDEELATARHTHRRGWSRAGGPWLGIADAGGLEVASTAHLVVDGFGHAQLASALFAAEDELATAPSLVAAARRLSTAMASTAAPALPGALPIGVATAVMAGPGGLAELIHATATALEAHCRRDLPPAARRRARFTPTIQIPIAPGRAGDPDRRARRVVPGLFALRMDRGEIEPLHSVRWRLRNVIEREIASAGVLTRMREAAARAPVPARLKRALLSPGVTPRRWLPPVEVLGGRGCLSSLRLPSPPVAPLWASSAPALDPTPGDPRGGTVVTVIHGHGELAITVSGTGRAGTAAGAQSFLDALLEAHRRIGVLTKAAKAGREPR